MPYDYDASNGRYWVVPTTLSETELDQQSSTSKSASAGAPPKPVSYYSDTGQLNCNCFFFVEGLDSEKVQTRIREVLASVGRLRQRKDITILGDQDLIASFVFKYVIQNNACDFGLMDECLRYLEKASAYLADKIGSPRLSTGRRIMAGASHISRCSYKFCTHTYCCQYNYPEAKKKKVLKGCFSDHFPHGKVYQDIVSLHAYVKKIRDSSDTDKIIIRSNQEIIKCINTIAYVIKHMHDELWNLYIASKKDPSYESLHKNVA